jgi:hypothetical protein
VRIFIVFAVGLAAAAAAAIALNLVLLGYTSPPGEPVGKLSPALPKTAVHEPVVGARLKGGERERDD